MGAADLHHVELPSGPSQGRKSSLLNLDVHLRHVELPAELAASAGGAEEARLQPAGEVAVMAGEFPYELLQHAPFPDGVNTAHRENYLSAADFLRVLGMDKAAFNAMPRWKQDAAKKRVNLF